MRKYGFSLTSILLFKVRIVGSVLIPYKVRIVDSVLIRGNMGQLKPVLSHIVCSVSLLSETVWSLIFIKDSIESIIFPEFISRLILSKFYFQQNLFYFILKRWSRFEQYAVMLSPASIYLFQVNKKHWKIVWNMFKVNNKNNSTTPLTWFWRFSC